MESSNEDFDEDDDGDDIDYTSEENRTDKSKHEIESERLKSLWHTNKKCKKYKADEEEVINLKSGESELDKKIVEKSPKGRFGRVNRYYKIV